MTVIWLIRHGESVSNAGLQTTHPAASEQTPLGHRQAAAVAQAFDASPDLLVVSRYVRAQQAAAPTRNRFPQVPVAEWLVHEFTYLAPEHYAGTTGAYRQPLRRAYWQRCDPASCDGDGAESFHALIARARACLVQLRERRESFIAIFGHGRFTQTLLWLLLEQPEEIGTTQMRDFHDFCHGLHLPNGAIVPLRYSADEGFWIGQIRIAHLADAG